MKKLISDGLILLALWIVLTGKVPVDITIPTPDQPGPNPGPVAALRMIIIHDHERQDENIANLLADTGFREAIDAKIGHNNWRAWDDQEDGTGSFDVLMDTARDKAPCIVVGDADGTPRTITGIDPTNISQATVESALAPYLTK